MSGSEYFTNRRSLKPRRNSANNCHSPRFTDKKSEARRSETTFAVAGGRQVAEKGLEPGQRGSRLSTCPPHEAARCVRKHVEAAKEAGHAGLCGKSLQAAGTAGARALRQEHVWTSGRTAEADGVAGGDECWAGGRSLRPHAWVLSSGWPAPAARGRDGVGQPARGGVGSA